MNAKLKIGSMDLKGNLDVSCKAIR